MSHHTTRFTDAVHHRRVQLVHELAIMESVVEAVTSQLDHVKIATIRIEIGQLAGISFDALRFCFDVCVRGTALDGATLELVEIAARARCRACGTEGAMEAPVSPCACGSFDRELIAGQELRIKELEVIDVP